MKFFSTLLKIRNPKVKIARVKTVEYRKRLILSCPPPINASLKPSIIGVMGFAKIYNLYFCGTTDKGYTMGEAYIRSCVPKLTR